MTSAQATAPGVRLPAAQRRAQLIEVARKVFAESSFTDTSMDDIAAAAGVTKPVLYRHFPSKRALVLEVLQDGIKRLTDALTEAVLAAEGPREQVEVGFRAFFEFIEREPTGYSLLFPTSTWANDDFSDEVRKFLNVMVERVSFLIVVPGVDEETRRFLAAGVVGMIDHATRVWFEAGFKPSASERARDLALLAWSGLRGITAPS